jgi:hypothetical protein
VVLQITHQSCVKYLTAMRLPSESNSNTFRTVGQVGSTTTMLPGCLAMCQICRCCVCSCEGISKVLCTVSQATADHVQPLSTRSKAARRLHDGGLVLREFAAHS